MAEQPGVWGIDIGQCALKAIRLQNVDGVLTATAFDYVEHPKILSQPDADPDALISEALEKFLSRNDLSGDNVAISVAGQSGLARFVKLPPVEEKKISEIVKFEAKQQIPFPLDEVVWDFQKIGAGIVTDGFAMETEIGLFAMKRDIINRVLAYFKDVNVEVHFVQMAPLALCNYTAYDLLKRAASGEQEGEVETDDDDDARGKKRCIVALDIGTDSSNLVITDGGKIIWQRPIPLGGNHFTKALSKDLKLTFAKAEHVKRNAAKSPDLAKILKALKPVLSDFVSEVQRSLGYFTNTHRDAYVSYMIGLGSAFRLPGLQKFLAEKLSLDVRKPAKLERLTGEATILDNEVFKENVLTFPVAYGLALQGLGLARLRTNLLPPEITFDRKIRAKKPWAVAAAAMLMLGTAMMTFGYAASYAAIADPKIESAMKSGKTVLERVTKVNGEIAAKQTDVETTQSDVKTIIAGQDERLNWIRLNEFINRHLPIPGEKDKGGTLLDRNQEVYWRSKEGMDAFADFQLRVRGGLPIDAPINTKLRSKLAMVDIAAVSCRYTDNLATYFATAKSYAKTNYNSQMSEMLKEDLEKAPEGAGWVVELRGSTYHDAGRAFVEACLLQNIARRDRVAIAEGQPPSVDPIQNKVTHAFVLFVHEDKSPVGNALIEAGRSYLDDLLATQGSGSGPGGPSSSNPMMSPMGPSSFGTGDPAAEADPAVAAAAAIAAWQPLTATGGNGGSGNMMGEGPMRSSSPMRSPPGGNGYPGGKGPSFTPMSSNPMRGPMVGPMIGPNSNPMIVDPDAKSRFEFVILFIWKEPTPSEKPLIAETPTDSTSTPK